MTGENVAWIFFALVACYFFYRAVSDPIAMTEEEKRVLRGLHEDLYPKED